MGNCASNYYNNGYNACYICKTNCSTCTSATMCNSCYYNMELNYPVAGNCACGQYQFWSSNYATCASCLAGSAYGYWSYTNNYGCGSCRDGDGWCYVCKAYWTWNGSNYFCYCNAPSYAASATSCLPCKTGCWSCAGSQCYSCTNGFTLHYPSNYLCGCLSNQFINAALSCQACPSYTYTCAETTGYSLTCFNTFAVVNNYCACPTGTCLTTVNGVPTCTALITCPTGQYNNGANTCVACPTTLLYCKTCALTAGVPLCTSCVSTTFTLNAASTTAPCTCAALQWRGTAPVQCNACPTLSTACSATGVATSCQTSYSIVNGGCACLTT